MKKKNRYKNKYEILQDRVEGKIKQEPDLNKEQTVETIVTWSDWMADHLAEMERDRVNAIIGVRRMAQRYEKMKPYEDKVKDMIDEIP